MPPLSLLAAAVEADRLTPWSQAWVADRMAYTDLNLTRVHDEGDDCCNGLRCMHYTRRPIAKVRGHGADKATGTVTSLMDSIMRLQGSLK